MGIAAIALASVLARSDADCRAMAKHSYAGAAVQTAEMVRRNHVPPFCRLSLLSKPVPGSQIGTEVWLPLAKWNGRYVQLGTGGFAGTIPEAGMAAEVSRGNAVAVTDTGHRGVNRFDASWAKGAPEAVIDYGWRSLSVSSAAAKAATAAFYGKTPRARYFVGCSNGGRQALMALQRDPEGWDGILAGSPAIRWTQQLTDFARIQAALRKRPEALIPLAMLPVIQETARARCSPVSTTLCFFEPKILACNEKRKASCLTPMQVEALRLIEHDYDPRWAAIAGGWDQWIVNPDTATPSQWTFASQFFENMVGGTAIPDMTGVDFAAASRLSPILDVAPPNLARFHAHSGKLIVYIGLADQVVSPRWAMEYARAWSLKDEAVLYVVPGMLHCQGGPEPNAFGQAPVAPPLKADGEHDIRTALEMWVEEGIRPTHLIAVKYRDDDSTKGVSGERALKAFAPRP